MRRPDPRQSDHLVAFMLLLVVWEVVVCCFLVVVGFVVGSKQSVWLPCVLVVALPCLTHPCRIFHCRHCLQSSFIPSSFDSSLDPLVASFQPKSGRLPKLAVRL